MGKTVSAILGALAYSNVMISPIWADTVPLAIPAPLPSLDITLPSIPKLTPVRFEIGKTPESKTIRNGLPKRVDRQADINAFGFPCQTELSSKPAANAMIDVVITASCKPDDSVAISYEGLTFDTTLSMTGQATLRIPALSKQSRVSIEFSDGVTLSSTVNISDLDGYMRVALGWSNNEAPSLSGNAPRHLPVTIVTLGDGSHRSVQVLSHHMDPDAKPGVIRLGMVSPVTQQNCGTSQSGNIVQHTPGLTQLRYDLTLAAVGCDEVGRNLELKNVLQDLKLAAN